MKSGERVFCKNQGRKIGSDVYNCSFSCQASSPGEPWKSCKALRTCNETILSLLPYNFRMMKGNDFPIFRFSHLTCRHVAPISLYNEQTADTKCCSEIILVQFSASLRSSKKTQPFPIHSIKKGSNPPKNRSGKPPRNPHVTDQMTLKMGPWINGSIHFLIGRVVSPASSHVSFTKSMRYCWWKKSCPTYDVKKTLQITRYLLSTGAGFLFHLQYPLKIEIYPARCWLEDEILKKSSLFSGHSFIFPVPWVLSKKTTVHTLPSSTMVTVRFLSVLHLQKEAAAFPFGLAFHGF